jgi:hypothetical protein
MAKRPLRILSRFYLVLFFSSIAVWIVWSVGWPNVSFESSEGNWADQEVQFKARDYEAILWYFEKYKTLCGLPNATLIRTTKQNWYNVVAWWSYWHDAKWKVPYRPPLRTAYFEPACANK